MDVRAEVGGEVVEYDDPDKLYCEFWGRNLLLD